MKEYGWKSENTSLSVIDWQTKGAELICNNQHFEVFSSHYSIGCHAEGSLIPVNTVSLLEKTDIRDSIVLLYGEIASQQIAPKNFPFWNPEEHQHLISLLEQGHPKALICATERNAATAGGVYPFPLFEYGNFDIPSVYMKDTEGERLLQHAGESVTLISMAERIPETAYNVIGRLPGDDTTKRVVITAHVDTKPGIPGAIDNATGVTVLLLLAELLKDKHLKYPIELVFFNGEDYYGASGQVEYINQNSGHFDDILLNINIDGAGHKEGLSCFSSMELPEDLAAIVNKVVSDTAELVEGVPWYQGDHSVFLQQGCPAIAVSSQWLIENMECQELTHTPDDNLEIVNYERVAECATAIAEIIRNISR
ncbi:MAG: DUF4910 domain-containing protein [Bacteroidales bacterium]|nr:DUF4910 domain-containing protein [Eubacteriales bacterium]MDD4670001.1 DUF4910 domain-containing protein [Bacteroidales bacterium]